MPDVWEYLINKYGIRSMVDIGCGYGHNSRWFLDRKFDVVGIEGYPDCIAKSLLPKENLVEHDYTKGAYIVPRKDLAWASEFVEHVEEIYIPNFVATMKCCRYLCMTHGEPGQDGWHHVTLKTTDWWRDKLEGYGLVMDVTETMQLRSTDKWKAGWGRRTLCWFVNQDFNDPRTDKMALALSG